MDWFNNIWIVGIVSSVIGGLIVKLIDRHVLMRRPEIHARRNARWLPSYSIGTSAAILILFGLYGLINHTTKLQILSEPAVIESTRDPSIGNRPLLDWQPYRPRSRNLEVPPTAPPNSSIALGFVQGDVVANDGENITIRGGVMGDVIANGGSYVTVGKEVMGDVGANGGSYVAVEKAVMGDIFSNGNSSIVVGGDVIGEVVISSNSCAIIRGEIVGSIVNNGGTLRRKGTKCR